MSYGKRILEKATLPASKPFRTNIYLSDQEVWARFVAKCKAHKQKSASHVLETMIRDFNETVPEPPKKK